MIMSFQSRVFLAASSFSYISLMDSKMRRKALFLTGVWLASARRRSSFGGSPAPRTVVQEGGEQVGDAS